MLFPEVWFACFEEDQDSNVQLRTHVSSGGGTADVGMDLATAMHRVVTSDGKIRLLQTV